HCNFAHAPEHELSYIRVTVEGQNPITPIQVKQLKLRLQSRQFTTRYPEVCQFCQQPNVEQHFSQAGREDIQCGTKLLRLVLKCRQLALTQRRDFDVPYAKKFAVLEFGTVATAEQKTQLSAVAKIEFPDGCDDAPSTIA